MTIIQQLVQYLRQNYHTSKTNPITATDLAIHFGISDGRVEVEMRNVIREAIAQNELIGSNNRGFYLIENLSELEENLDSLESRAQNILQRRRNMMNSWNSKNPTNTTSRTDLNVL
ncbi:hypothetical protein CS546_02780 [Porphyromonas gingivalis]|uniref:hypothetical protein n=1 Tax=Porphyromonas gingivalis TaxID=837 RepID=UPI000C19C442|nr:hypothetical protein [Porphyromonas gingivalis]ATR94036.1 hypothetical protein CS546_02780 [Porphyromonas gingivalis]ATR97198.1 hypothetical protein CS548_09145 [Porphyromonas gingivalis]